MLNFPLSRRQAVTLLLSSAIGTAPLAASAQASYPNKPVRFVNWSNPGGNLDIVGRLLAEHASRKWGQPVVTDNRIGASGMIATDHVAKSPADGYTVLITSSTGQLTNALVRLKLPFDPVKDFEPVSLLVAGNLGLTVSADAPYNNLQEMMAYAKKLGRPLTYGTPGRGTSAHLYGESLRLQSGMALTHVPYKGGEMGAVTDIIGGILDFTLLSQGNAKTQSQSGRVKVIAMSGTQRTSVLPQLPTFEEQGFKGFGLAGWIAAYVPAGTPKVVVEQISATFREILRDPEVAARLQGLGYEVIGGTPDELRNFYQQEYARFSTMVKAAGIEPE